MPVITTLRIHNILYPGTLLPAQGSFSLCLDWSAVFALLCLSFGHVLAQCQCETAVPERQGQACATREEWLPILQGQLRPSARGSQALPLGPFASHTHFFTVMNRAAGADPHMFPSALPSDFPPHLFLESSSLPRSQPSAFLVAPPPLPSSHGEAFLAATSVSAAALPHAVQTCVLRLCSCTF